MDKRFNLNNYRPAGQRRGEGSAQQPPPPKSTASELTQALDCLVTKSSTGAPSRAPVQPVAPSKLSYYRNSPKPLQKLDDIASTSNPTLKTSNPYAVPNKPKPKPSWSPFKSPAKSIVNSRTATNATASTSTGTSMTTPKANQSPWELPENEDFVTDFSKMVSDDDSPELSKRFKKRVQDNLSLSKKKRKRRVPLPVPVIPPLEPPPAPQAAAPYDRENMKIVDGFRIYNFGGSAFRSKATVGELKLYGRNYDGPVLHTSGEAIWNRNFNADGTGSEIGVTVPLQPASSSSSSDPNVNANLNPSSSATSKPTEVHITAIGMNAEGASTSATAGVSEVRVATHILSLLQPALDQIGEIRRMQGVMWDVVEKLAGSGNEIAKAKGKGKERDLGNANAMEVDDVAHAKVEESERERGIGPERTRDAEMVKILGLLADRVKKVGRDVGVIKGVLGVPFHSDFSSDDIRTGNSFSIAGRKRRREEGQDDEPEIQEIPNPNLNTEGPGRSILERLDNIEMDVQEWLERARDPLAGVVGGQTAATGGIEERGVEVLPPIQTPAQPDHESEAIPTHLPEPAPTLPQISAPQVLPQPVPSVVHRERGTSPIIIMDHLSQGYNSTIHSALESFLKTFLSQLEDDKAKAMGVHTSQEAEQKPEPELELENGGEGGGEVEMELEYENSRALSVSSLSSLSSLSSTGIEDDGEVEDEVEVEQEDENEAEGEKEQNDEGHDNQKDTSMSSVGPAVEEDVFGPLASNMEFSSPANFIDASASKSKFLSSISKSTIKSKPSTPASGLKNLSSPAVFQLKSKFSTSNSKPNSLLRHPRPSPPDSGQRGPGSSKNVPMTGTPGKPFS